MHRFYRSLVLIGVVSVFSVSVTAPAFASTNGRKNTALALTAATAYSALTKNDRAALVGAAATAQAWKNYEDSRKRDSRKKSYTTYRPRATYSTPAKRSYSKPKTYTSSRTTYRKPVSSSRAHARPASYSRPVSQVRPAVVKRVSTAPTSSAQVTQLKSQIAKLEAQNTELKRQAEINKLRAENTALRAELAKQKDDMAAQQTLIADARSDMSASRLHSGITAIVAVLAIGLVLGLGRLSKIGK